MSKSIDLERVEKDARQIANQDGITYLFMGILLTVVGVSFLFPALSWIGISGILFIFAALAIGVLIVAALVWPRILPVLVGVVFALSFYFGASMNGVRLRDWVVIGLVLLIRFMRTHPLVEQREASDF